MIIGNDNVQTSNLRIKGGNIVLSAGTTGTLIIGKKDCESASGSCSKQDLNNIPKKYVATPVGPTVVVNKNTGVVTKDVVSAVKLKCAPLFTTSGTKKESTLSCSPQQFKDFAASGPECKAKDDGKDDNSGKCSSYGVKECESKSCSWDGGKCKDKNSECKKGYKTVDGKCQGQACVAVTCQIRM